MKSRSKIIPALQVDQPVTKQTLMRALVRQAGGFLTMDSLASAPMFLASLKEFVDSTCGTNSVGSFLLRGRVHWVFTLVVRLKQLAFKTLLTNYNMKLNTMGSLEITGHPVFSKLHSQDQVLLENVGHSSDNVPGDTTFWLLDGVSVGVFMAVYLLTEERHGNLQEAFLESHAGAIAEVRSLLLPCSFFCASLTPCLAEFADLRPTGLRPEQVPPLPGQAGAA